MELDHIFVCTGKGAPEAELLIASGFAEGPANRHPGQGTACRRFFFDNAYLELVWVADEAEARGGVAAPTRLWDRWRERIGGRVSPFGICVRTPAGEVQPFRCWSYRPDYLPPESEIPIATADEALEEPMIFVVPAALRRAAESSAGPGSAVHPNGARTLTRVRLSGAFERPGEALSALEGAGLLDVESSARPLLQLEWRGGRSVSAHDLRPALPLILSF